MRLEVSQLQSNGFVEVTAVHGDQRLVWQTKSFIKVKLTHPERVFDEINAYWEAAGPEVQEHVWNQYVKIKDIMSNMVDSFYIGQHVRHYVREMYKLMPMQSFFKWLLNQGNLFIPSDIQDRITGDSRYKSTEQTYLRADYIELATVALAVRPMLPIWGEYIDQGMDRDTFKEMEAAGLLDGTELMTWPQTDDKPSVLDKLNLYIRFCTEDTPVSLSNLWRGMGSSEIIDWLQSKAIVRRLTIVPLCDTGAHSIIANIYRYVKSNIKPVDRSTSDRVNEKRPEGNGGDEDDKTSFLEAYKTKIRLTDGDATGYEVDTENYALLVQTVDPTVDLNLLVLSIQQVEEVSKYPVHEHQVRIAQWVMAKAFSPRAFWHIPELAVHRLAACAQTLLWHWGFLELAMFMQVREMFSDSQPYAALPKTPKSGSRIGNRFKEELNLWYPHVKQQRPKPGEIPGSKTDNRSAIAINHVTAEIRRGTWEYHGPRELYRLANQPEGRNIVVIPTTLKDVITQLAIHLAKINQ